MQYLLHVGMPQSASSFLQDVFFPACDGVHIIAPRDPHNRIEFYNPMASLEGHFWSEDEAASWLRRKCDPQRLNVLSFERFSSAPQLSRRDIAERLARLCPGAKCLIVIRNQADAIISAYSQRARVPNLFLPCFDHYFEANMRDARASEFRRYFYNELVEIYEGLFGAESVLVLPYEMLKAEGPRFVSRLCQFTGIPLPDPDITRPRPNKRVSGAYIAARRAVQTFVAPETLRRIWLGLPVPARRRLKSLVARTGRWEHRLTTEQIRSLCETFGPSNQALSRRHRLRLFCAFNYPRHGATSDGPRAAASLADCRQLSSQR